MRLVQVIARLPACALFVIGIIAAVGAPYGSLRMALLAIGAVAAVFDTRRTVLALVTIVPWLPVVSRTYMGNPDLSLAEHLVLGVLAAGLLRAAPAPRPDTGAIDRALVLYLALILASLASLLCEYHAVGVSPAGILWESATRYFAPDLVDFGQDRFLIVRDTCVLLLGGLWWLLISPRALGLGSPQLARALTIGLLGACLVAMAQWYWEFAPVRGPDQRIDALFHLTGSWHDNNTFAVYLVLIGPLAIVRAWQDCRRWYAVGPFALLAVFVLLHTGSRAGWIAAAASGALATVVLLKAHKALGIAIGITGRRWLTGALGLAGVIVIGGVCTATYFDLGRTMSYAGASDIGRLVLFTANLRRPASELLSGRTAYWQAAGSIWSEHRWMGCGIGRYRLAKLHPPEGVIRFDPRTHPPDPRGELPFFTTAHNQYFQVLSELGLVGLAAFALVAVAIGGQVRRAWQSAGADARQRIAAIGVGLFGFAACCLTQDPLTVREMQIVFWTIVAAVAMETR